MKKKFTSILVILLDIAFLIILFYLTTFIRSHLKGTYIPEYHPLLLKDFFFVIVILSILLYVEKIYTLRYDFWQEMQKIWKAGVLAYFIVLALLMLGKVSDEYSRLFITLYFLLFILFFPLFKRVIKRLLYTASSFRYKVHIVGNQDQKERLIQEFQKNWYLGMEHNDKQYDIVVISSKGLSIEEISEMIDRYLSKNRLVYIIPYVTNINFVNSTILEYSNIRYNFIGIENRLLIKKNIWIKKSFELFLIFLSLPLLVSFHIIIALLIKFDSKGAIFFKQERLGKDGKIFFCYKYRTMYENCDELLQKYLKEYPDEILYYEKYHKYRNDPRITKIGKFLRELSLDELPQIINVIKGEMSLVGPRPYMVSESKKLGKYKDLILKVKPGITGLWQVSGRNNLTFNERNELEVWYIKNWSLWGDFVILLKTIKAVLMKIGAR